MANRGHVPGTTSAVAVETFASGRHQAGLTWWISFSCPLMWCAPVEPYIPVPDRWHCRSPLVQNQTSRWIRPRSTESSPARFSCPKWTFVHTGILVVACSRKEATHEESIHDDGSLPSRDISPSTLPAVFWPSFWLFYCSPLRRLMRPPPKFLGNVRRMKVPPRRAVSMPSIVPIGAPTIIDTGNTAANIAWDGCSDGRFY